MGLAVYMSREEVETMLRLDKKTNWSPGLSTGCYYRGGTCKGHLLVLTSESYYKDSYVIVCEAHHYDYVQYWQVFAMLKDKAVQRKKRRRY